MTELQTSQPEAEVILPPVRGAKTYVPIEISSWNMIKSKQVDVTASTTKKGVPIAIINVNDGELVHKFDPSSRISKSLSVTPTTAIAERLTNGHFFVMNNELVDFKDNTFTGFIHDTDAIQKLIDVLGAAKIANRHAGLKSSSTQGDIVLTHSWGTDELVVPEYQAGGQFNSILRYNWSPFSQSIRSVFELVRLVCSNGMIGVTDFFNAKIPVINRWEEHMDIAYKQIQNKVQGRVRDRIIEMGQERASVGELLQIAGHATERATKGAFSMEERGRLLTIAQLSNPKMHLGQFYKPAAFEDQSVAGRLPGHLTTFDAWNMVTEMYSHTSASTNSSDTALQRLANVLMFDGEKRQQKMSMVGHQRKSVSSFSSPERAFFGVTA